MNSNLEGTKVSKTKKILKHFHCKVNSLTLAFILIPMLMLGASSDTMANQVVDRVTTEVTLFFDDKVINFETDSFDLSGAVMKKGVDIGDRDVVEPPLETKLSGGSITAKVRRAVPIKVEDEGVSSNIFSGYENPKAVLEQNEITVYEEDKVYEDLIFDFFKEKALGRKIIIRRAPVVFVNADNEDKEYRTWKGTVGEMLAEKGVLLGERDKVFPDRTHYIFNKIMVQIVRVAESEAKESEAIPYDTKNEEDSTLEYGKTLVKQEGKNGKKEHTYKIISENGAMVSKTLVKTETVAGPTTKIVVKGTKPRTTFYGAASHMSPGIYGAGGCAFRGYRGSTLKVTNQNNGRSVLVKVVDYGPAVYTGRIIDLSYDDFVSLSGSTGIMGNVRVDVLN